MLTARERKFVFTSLAVGFWLGITLTFAAGLIVWQLNVSDAGPPIPEPIPDPLVDVPEDLVPLFEGLVNRPRYAEEMAHLYAAMEKAVSSDMIDIGTTGEFRDWTMRIKPLWFRESMVTPAGLDSEWQIYLRSRFGVDPSRVVDKPIDEDMLIATLRAVVLAAERAVSHGS